MKKITKKEIINLCISLLLFYVFWQIHYFRQNPWQVIKLTIGHFYLFILPGYFLLLKYIHQINFAYRIFIGAGIGYSLVLIIVYLLNLIFKLDIMITYIIIPIIFIVTGIIIFYIKNRRVNG